MFCVGCVAFLRKWRCGHEINILCLGCIAGSISNSLNRQKIASFFKLWVSIQQQSQCSGRLYSTTLPSVKQQLVTTQGFCRLSRQSHLSRESTQCYLISRYGWEVRCIAEWTEKKLDICFLGAKFLMQLKVSSLDKSFRTKFKFQNIWCLV